MANNSISKDSPPVAPLKIAALESCRDLAAKVNDHITQFRRNNAEELMRRKENLHYRGYDVDSYLPHCSCPRFRTDKGKAAINESVRSTDAFIMVDVMNYSIPYTVSGHTSHMSPDDHFQDLKRIIGVCSTTAHRVNVVVPFLYESHQHKRNKHEFLDCAMALEGLTVLGMENIITSDAHDPRIQNTVPLTDFDNFMPACQFIKTLFPHDSNIHVDKEHLMVVSPDEGAMNRAVYLTNNLGMDMGMFYKRRDYSQVIGDRNPVVTHEFLGSSVKDRTVLIIDDMIFSGKSMLDTCKELKGHKVDKVVVCYTFGPFTNGLEKFDEYYHRGYLDHVITTNLNYHTQELPNRKWCLEADMSKYLAAVISSPNHDRSISVSLSPMEKTQKLARKHQNSGYEYFQKLV